jgi:hypothetical protein
MKLPPKAKPHAVASRDHTRYVLNHVAIQGDLAVATNGRVLFACEATVDEGDTIDGDALIPKKALALAKVGKMKGKRRKDSAAHWITLEGNRVKVSPSADESHSLCLLQGAKYPEWKRVVPKAGPKVLSFNVRLLASLAEAFGEDLLTLHFDPDSDTKQILVTSDQHRDRFGVMMPCRTNDKEGPDSIAILQRILSETATKEEQP